MIPSSESRDIGAWWFEWLATRWPPEAIRRAVCGYAVAHRPCTKNVAGASSASSVSRIRSALPGGQFSRLGLHTANRKPSALPGLVIALSQVEVSAMLHFLKKLLLFRVGQRASRGFANRAWSWTTCAFGLFPSAI